MPNKDLRIVTQYLRGHLSDITQDVLPSGVIIIKFQNNEILIESFSCDCESKKENYHFSWCNVITRLRPDKE